MTYFGNVSSAEKSKYYVPMNSETLYDLFQMEDFCYSLKFETVDKFMEEIKKFSVMQILVFEKTFKQRN